MNSIVNKILNECEYNMDDIIRYIKINNIYNLKFNDIYRIFNDIDANYLDIINFSKIGNYKRILNSKFNEILYYIEDNEIPKFLELYFNGDIKFLKEIIYLLKSYCPLKSNYAEDYIKKYNNSYDLYDNYKNKYFLVYDLLRSHIYNLNESDKCSLTEIIIRLFDEICTYEKVPLSNIKYVIPGCYNSVYRLGNKIIKLGRREQYTMNNNKYIVKPLIRFNLNTICKDSDLVIEVLERLNIKDLISEEEIIRIFLDLRRQGIIFADPKADNFGKLIKDNKRYWDRDLGDYNGIIGTCDEELKAGDYAILDLDYIYNLNAKITETYAYDMIKQKIKKRYI